ncbi:carbohydrate ABC transporter permease [Mesomycoplasma neurolyticum]|uniref:Maltose transport system permease protein malG n=1 Tax=Mesomycoplasma neurolyticum TaxID=2120 RepID=A0A449A4Y6_9BACT|nr:carbohydrate ABC transporter permease [Mesomycoplasma neurolyticum]VEU59282.1 Maltose transport system permease protein malG [Mesomycoplasma neurolyticum]
MDFVNKIKFSFSKTKALKLTLFFGLFILATVWIFPYFLMTNTSFKSLSKLVTKNIFSLPTPYETANYTRAFTALRFSESFIVSILVTIISNITIIFISSICAWQLARNKSIISKIIFYCFLITMIVPFQAIMLPLISVMGRMRFLNLFGLIFMYTGFGLSMSIFMMHGFLSNIPLSLEEVAKVEGYNPFKVYFKIILPLLKPIIATILIINTIWIWNDFLLPFLVYLSNNKQPTTTVVRLKEGLVGSYGTDFTAIMAGLTILVIPIIAFFIIMQKHIISGITNGAIK